MLKSVDMSNMDKNEAIKNVLTRNVETVIDKNHLENALKSGKKLRVKLGIDPTAPDLHLGHTVVLEKLREFQKLGHKAVLIMGDFTASIGDPSGKSKTRPPLSDKEIKKNMKTYLDQAGLIIDVKKAEIRFNSEWLGALRGAEILKLLSKVSVQQILERDDFKKRMAEQASIRGHELLYPIMQGYDSVAIKADVELGGNDQTFNLLMGRQLMERLEMKPQDILTVPLLVGLDGKQKMSKSLGNYVGISESPDEQFGKIMSLNDSQIIDYFLLVTDAGEDTIKKYEKDLKDKKVNPKTIKEELAKLIVARYHGEKAAIKAKENFEKLFVKKEFSGEMPEIIISTDATSSGTVANLVIKSKVAKSNSEAWRLIQQGALEIDGEVIKNPRAKVEGKVAKIGKKNFFRIKIK